MVLRGRPQKGSENHRNERLAKSGPRQVGVGYCARTVGLDESRIRKYIQEQEKHEKEKN